MFDLASELKAAKSGATITIPAGDYGDVIIRRVAGLSLKAEADATFRSLVLSECSELALTGLDIAFTPDEKSVSNTSALRLSLCQDVTVEGGRIIGGPAIAGLPQDASVDVPRAAVGDAIIGLPIGRGISIENSNDVAVRGIDVGGFHKGLVLSHVAGLKVQRMAIHDVRTSTIVGGNVSRALIEDSHLHSARPWNFGGKGDHGDFIHLWTVAGKQDGPSEDIVIRSNLIDQGQGDAILGIYFDDKGNGLGFAKVLVEGNTILNGNAQGIAMERVAGAVLGNTFVQTSGTAKQGPSILFREACAVEVDGNSLPDTYGTIAKAAAGGIYGKNILRPLGVASAEELASLRSAWAARFALPVTEYPAPVGDRLREVFSRYTVAKIEPLKTKGRVIVDFKTPVEGQAALAAVLGLS
jgi:Right handed beta helix region